jgi:hypothetical protein
MGNARKRESRRMALKNSIVAHVENISNQYTSIVLILKALDQ